MKDLRDLTDLTIHDVKPISDESRARLSEQGAPSCRSGGGGDGRDCGWLPLEAHLLLRSGPLSLFITLEPTVE